MSPQQVISDPGDPRVADYVRLNDPTLRRRLEPEHGLFIAEGRLVIGRALRAGYPLRSLLLAAESAGRSDDLTLTGPADGPANRVPEPCEAPVYLASGPLLQALTGFHVHRGALASFGRRPVPTPAAVLAGARLVAVLEDLSNPTNLGAVFRCAAGLGVDAVLLSPRCADPLYRRALRVSMGEVFAIPYARLEPWPAALGEVRDAGFRLLALTPDPAAVPLDRLGLRPEEPAAVLLGAEGSGLTPTTLAAADVAVRIPMRRGVDSLNIAAAAAVAFYVLGSGTEQDSAQAHHPPRRRRMTDELTPDEQTMAAQLRRHGEPVVESMEESVPAMEAALDDTTYDGFGGGGSADADPDTPESVSRPAADEPDGARGRAR